MDNNIPATIQPKQPSNNFFINIVKKKFEKLDERFTILIPNQKIRRALYIYSGVFLGLVLLILLIGIIFLPFKNEKIDDEFVLNKPAVIISSPVPSEELSNTDKKLLNIEGRINDLKFPESIINIPVIESDIEI